MSRSINLKILNTANYSATGSEANVPSMVFTVREDGWYDLETAASMEATGVNSQGFITIAINNFTIDGTYRYSVSLTGARDSMTVSVFGVKLKRGDVITTRAREVGGNYILISAADNDTSYLQIRKVG